MLIGSPLLMKFNLACAQCVVALEIVYQLKHCEHNPVSMSVVMACLCVIALP